MRVVLSALFLVLAAVVQVSVLPPFLGDRVNVDLVLIVVVAWGIIRGVQEGLLWGLIAGLILDVVSVVPFGTTMVVLGLIGLLSGIRGRWGWRSSTLTALVVAAVASIVYYVLLMGIVALFGREWHWLTIFWGIVLPAVMINAIAMLPVFWLLDRFNRRIDPDRNKNLVRTHV